MKTIVFCAFSLWLLWAPVDLHAQRKWKAEYYQELNDDNFRDFKLFKKTIDLNKIDYPLLNAAIFFVTNEARLEQGLTLLEYQPNLEIMAYNHSVSMAKDDFFDHENSKDRKRKTPTQRAKLAGIKNPHIGENIHAAGGRQFGTYIELADYVVQSWIDSPPHRVTMYSPDAVQLGCGIYFYDGKWQNYKDVYKQGNGFWIATQNFQLFTKVESGPSKDKGPKE
ncbi:CAP domain-containing protein [Roseivirga sp.]|uniref:CAP domain-containing protein n=1 Tax=Roseivirga sp. TaxID=1964215 RepID=UPI003B52AE67